MSELLGSAFLFASARRVLLAGSEGEATPELPDEPADMETSLGAVSSLG